MTANTPETPNEDSSAKAEATLKATFFRPYDELHIHRGNLPHWRQTNVTYFVTTRLADSMPQEKLREWQTKRDACLAAHDLQNPSAIHQLPEDQQHEFHATFTKEWHQWLGAGYGECQLRRLEVRDILIRRFLAESSLDAWVIMPNHLHALVAPEHQGLGEVLQSWKGGSAFEINRLLGRIGPLWQKEPYDHIVGAKAQFQHYRRYIAENPIKAGLEPHEYAVGLGKQPFKVTAALAEVLQPPRTQI
jgi:REP element-mobilizing transposase RayT